MNADAGVDKPAPGFEPRSVQLNPEFDARETSEIKPPLGTKFEERRVPDYQAWR